LSLGSYTT